MNFESGFLAKNGNMSELNDSEGFTGFQMLSASKTGFFCILAGKHLGRKVVIKTLKEEHARNTVAITQLNKEFSILFPLVSPNVVHALSLIKLEGDVPAFEMEWCEGSDVREMLHGDLDPDDAVRIIGGVLNGLKDIHLAGIVHRDIKPENVIYDPFRKIVKIIDFGCAYVTGGLTLQGPNGTPGYTPDEKMSPGTEAEPKDDLYALGVMAAELAENISADSKRAASVKRKLTRFSDNLKAGEYEKAENATYSFEKLLRESRNFRLPVIIGLTGVFSIIALLLLNLFLLKPKSSQEISSNDILSDSLITIESPGSGIPEEIRDPATDDSPTTASDLTGSGSNEEIAFGGVQKEDPVVPVPFIQGEWKNPYSGISSEDESAYELAVYAGKLMEMYNSKHAPQKVMMDGFVVHFCDSLCLSEKLSSKYPSHIDPDDARELAKELSAKYKNKMEKEFHERFGNAGDPHRREVMLEGRFYGAFQSYNYNPWAKRASEKSN